jgi:hypothetical protein
MIAAGILTIGLDAVPKLEGARMPREEKGRLPPEMPMFRDQWSQGDIDRRGSAPRTNADGRSRLTLLNYLANTRLSAI